MDNLDQRIQLPTSITKSPTLSDTLQPPSLPVYDSKSTFKTILVLMLKIILALVTCVILLILGVQVYFKYYKLAYSDKYYGFIIKDQRGWYSVPKHNSAYYMIGTSDSPRGLVISTFAISPIEHVSGNNQIDEQWVDELCIESARSINAQYINTSDIKINNLQGKVCLSEGKADKINKLYIYKQYILINEDGKKYDYLIATSQPKDDMNEDGKVKRLLDSFYAK